MTMIYIPLKSPLWWIRIPWPPEVSQVPTKLETSHTLLTLNNVSCFPYHLGFLILFLFNQRWLWFKNYVYFASIVIRFGYEPAPVMRSGDSLCHLEDENPFWRNHSNGMKKNSNTCAKSSMVGICIVISSFLLAVFEGEKGKSSLHWTRISGGCNLPLEDN